MEETVIHSLGNEPPVPHLSRAAEDCRNAVNVGLVFTAFRTRLLHEIGREPTPEELAEKLGMPLEKVRKVLKIAREPLSLETPIGDEEDSHLGDLIEDKNAILPIDAAIQSNLRETTTRVLALLSPREERVLRMRFGIGMNKPYEKLSR
jgi:DNA-directed RNA polymerase sigma subunit (sigma70/sigma32)